MADSPEENDYISFMQWFQNNYPDLYASYWQEITPPINGQRVTIHKHGMNEITYNEIIRITGQYYQEKNR